MTNARALHLLASLATLSAGLGCARGTAIDESTASAPLGDGEHGVSPGCAALYPKDWKPVVGANRQHPVDRPKPTRGEPFAEPTFKTCVVRLTDHTADKVQGFARNDYSRRQAFNADDTRVIVAAQDGTWHTYDVASRRYLGLVTALGGDAEPQWHPTNPNLLYYFPPFGIGMKIHEVDIRNGVTRVAADLGERIKAVWPKAASAWTKSEGSPSRDARYWGLMVDDAEWNGLGMLTYDLVTDTILATYDFAKNGKGRPDHVSMSPSGAYMVASWGDGTYSFPRDLGTPLRVNPKTEHSDLAIGADGDDVYVSVNYEGKGGPVYMTSLRTGAQTPLFNVYPERGAATAIHFSGRAFQKPGWVLVSTYGEQGKWQWNHRKVFAVELKEKPRVVHLAHTHSAYKDYFTEPHASVNRDFTRVVFGSNWEASASTDIDTYLVEVPRGALR